jgi:1,5-anhydro-D-fructose reductase (1,5-anhydro-D-mannitol-forming)
MFRVAMVSKWHVHANGYANEISDIPGVLITAVWDEQSERGREWAEALDAEFEPDYAKLLARSDVDGVLICSPTSMHKELIIAAAKAGKHIFTEKVLAFTAKEAREIAEAVKQSGVRFVISYPRKMWASTQFAKKSLEGGLLGAPTLLLSRTSHNGATANWLPDSFFNEAQAGGGAMMDFGAHPMYLARWILGKPVRITSMFNHFTAKPLEDNAVSIVEFENKAMAIIQTNFVCDRCPNSFELHGTLGSIVQEENDKPVKIYAPQAPVDDCGELLPDALPDTLATPLAQWADACMNNTQPVGCGIEEAVELSELMEGAYKSFREKRVVEFSELG